MHFPGKADTDNTIQQLHLCPRPQQPRAAVYFLTESQHINNINILHICSRLETFSQDTNIRYKQGT